MQTRRPLFAVVLFLLSFSAVAQNGAPSEIGRLMDRQAAAWNRGDLPAFAAFYKDTPDLRYVGKTVRRGYRDMLESYRRNYPDRAAMGTLQFSSLEVLPLDERFATATGYFHLERTQKGGGNADGIFSLVLERTSAGWKIIRDHSSAAPPPPGRVLPAAR